MSLQAKVMEELKEAMKAKNTVALESLRAIKSAILLAKTEAGATEELTEADELKLLQKLVKQRKDSAALYSQQGREDLAQPITMIASTASVLSIRLAPCTSSKLPGTSQQVMCSSIAPQSFRVAIAPSRIP